MAKQQNRPQPQKPKPQPGSGQNKGRAPIRPPKNAGNK